MNIPLIRMAFFVSVVLIFCIGQRSQGDTPYAQENFDTYINGCKKNEIRCLYFSKKLPDFGTEVEVNLVTKVVEMAQLTYRGRNDLCLADQHELTKSKISTVRSLVANLPSFTSHSSYSKSIFISVRSDDGIHIYKYARNAVPPDVIKLYLIVGEKPPL